MSGRQRRANSPSTGEPRAAAASAAAGKGSLGGGGATPAAPIASVGGVQLRAGAWEADAALMDAMGLGDVQMRGEGGAGDADGVHQAAAAGVEGPGGPMPFQEQIQQAFGPHDISGVQAHTGADAARANQAMGAEAYATGGHVAFGSTPTLHTAAHEAAHVVQQRGGVQLKGGVGEVGDAYEQHADRVADAVVAGASAAPILDEMAGTGGGASVQRVVQHDRHHATGPAGGGPNTVSAGAASPHGTQTVTYASITAGTIDQFIQLSDAQADWSMQISDAAQQTTLRGVLGWLRASPNRSVALGTFTVADLVAHTADYNALDAYARAHSSTDTVPVGTATTLADALAWGVDVLKLEAVLAGPQLHHLFTDTWFQQLRTQNKVDAFCSYVTTVHPVLQAPEGKEIDSYLAGWREGADPATFHDLTDIRNYHRFQNVGLARLRVNQAGNPGNLPLCLILHSAFDWNGAFHRDPNLTDVLRSTTNHTIMIEGAESLDAIAARLPAIVAVHGRLEPDPNNPAVQVRRIDQVMIAGHGSAHSIELGGTLQTDGSGRVQTDDDGSPRTNDDSLDITANPHDPASVARAARSRALMAQIMGLMSQDPSSPHRRIIFNACLTASNEIDPHAIDPHATPDQQAQQMQQAIQTSPSLVTAMRQIATTQGRAVDVRGGNGSFGQVGLMDGTGALDIVADGVDPDGPAGPADPRTLDPELTNPDKLVYVERGRDPDGCMSAVAERWAQDRTTLIPAVQRRRAHALGTGWQETLIQAMYEIVETRYASNGAGIVRLASVTSGFDELASSSMSRVWSIWNLGPNEDWRILHDRLSVHGDWTSQPFVPIVFFQGWMFHDRSKIRDFLGAVGAMTVSDSHDFLDMPALRPMWNQLVPAHAAHPPDPGQLRLALRDFHDNPSGAQAHTRSFLRSLVQHGAFTVDVDGPLGGLDNAHGVLAGLGLLPTQAGSHTSGPAPDGNVDMDNDALNESLVEAMSATGRVTAEQLYVRDQASVNGRNHPTTLHRGDTVHIMGQTPQWYLIDHDGVRGYSYRSYIEIVT